MSVPNLLSQEFSEIIRRQKHRCITRSSDSSTKERLEKAFDWFNFFAQEYLSSREQRATEITDSQVRFAQEAAKFFHGAGNFHFFATCVDGRNMPTVMFSQPPHVGGNIRTPAGNLTGFMDSQAPHDVFIDEESIIIQKVRDILLDRQNMRVFFGLDSHVGCAARGQLYTAEGGSLRDGGLRSDIQTKMLFARGLLRLRQHLSEKQGAVAAIFPYFFSYDPHSGEIITGLEMHIDDPAVASQGFTPEVITQLAKNEVILRTSDLWNTFWIRNELEQALGDQRAHVRTQYPRFLAQNWHAITQLYNHGQGRVFRHIFERILQATSLSGWQVTQRDMPDYHEITQENLMLRAKILLKNLVTRVAIAGFSQEWEFDTHQEGLTVITDGGFAPFSQLDAFAVFSQDHNGLVQHTKLTLDLIRQFRATDKIVNPIATMPLTREEFVAAPILISNKAIVKNISQQEWDEFGKLPLTNLFESLNWDNPEIYTWRRSHMLKYLHEGFLQDNVRVSPQAMLSFIDGLYECFDRFRILMSDKHMRKMILHGNVMVLNTMVDLNRMPHMALHLTV